MSVMTAMETPKARAAFRDFVDAVRTAESGEWVASSTCWAEVAGVPYSTFSWYAERYGPPGLWVEYLDKRKAFAARQKERAMELVAKGERMIDAAAATGLSFSTVNQLAQKLGVGCRRQKYHPKQFRAVWAEMTSTRPATVRELAAVTGASLRQVRRWLCSGGLAWVRESSEILIKANRRPARTFFVLPKKALAARAAGSGEPGR